MNIIVAAVAGSLCILAAVREKKDWRVSVGILAAGGIFVWQAMIS